jgi:hypothetical protein
MELKDNIQSTKFIMAMVCLILVFIAFMAGKLDGQTFMPFVLGILGIFTTGNTLSKFADKDSAN